MVLSHMQDNKILPIRDRYADGYIPGRICCRSQSSLPARSFLACVGWGRRIEDRMGEKRYDELNRPHDLGRLAMRCQAGSAMGLQMKPKPSPVENHEFDLP